MRRAEEAIDGAKIKRLRNLLSLTQQQLAQLLGVHPMTVSKWERDQAEPTPYNIQQLLLLENGAARMGESEQQSFKRMVATGLFVGALAFAVGLAVQDIGESRGWW